MLPFIRRVDSLKVLKQERTDETFFQGQDYALVPLSVTSVLDAWCKDTRVANTAVPSKGATSDDPQDVYYIELGTEAGRDEFKAMLKALAPALMASVNDAASAVTVENLLTLEANASFDELAAAAAFRDALLRFDVKPRKSASTDPVLIIGV